MRQPLHVPALVEQRATSHGAAGHRWLADLPNLLATLADDWRLHIGDVFHGGTAALVVAATDADDRACVLKVVMRLTDDDDDAFERSVLTHQLADGHGCAALYAVDRSNSAMLLERLGPNLDDLNLPVPTILDTVAATLREFWRPIDADIALPTAVDQATWLREFIASTWTALDRPCPRDVVERALALCDERAAAFETTKSVLVHGDAHGWNTLAAGRETFKFVDPEGLRSEPAHDLAVPMREYNAPLLAGDTARLVRARAERLAIACDVDPEAVWQWGFIERVSTGLANLRDFDDGSGQLFLQVAERCR